jgi:Zn-dependent peptidase ImmA (M78 family)/transcriptional regulator with XRE-family HTH domain
MSVAPTIEIQGEVLVWARKTIGLSIEDAARKLKVDVDKLKDWESGTQSPPIRKIKQFAVVYKRPTAAFLFDQKPKNDLPPKFRDYLAYKGELSSDTWLLFRRALRIRDTFKQIETSKNQFIIELESLKGQAIETISETIVTSLGADYKTAYKSKDSFAQLAYWRRLIEKKGIIVIESKFPRDDARGFAIFDHIAPVIVLNTEDGPLARIFTLMHELGHFVYGQDGIDDTDNLRDYVSKTSEEYKCNNIAANILMPKQFVQELYRQLESDPDLSLLDIVSKLAKSMNISREAALTRLWRLGEIDYDDYSSSLRAIKSTQRKPKKKSEDNFPAYYVTTIKGNGRVFLSRVFEEYRNNKLSLHEVVDYTGIRKVETLFRLEGKL